MTPKEIYQCGLRLFENRSQLMSLWQEIANNFYPERADFTTHRVLGQEFAADLMTSYPLIARRDLGNTLGTMLRPTAKPWFHTRTTDKRINEDVESRRWLEWAESVQRQAMYDVNARLSRATKEGDHDFAAFGQCAISVELNKEATGLLYRCWHLRDVAWVEDEEGKVGQVYRKWKPTLRNLDRIFPGKLPENAKNKISTAPFDDVNCVHMVVPADMCDGDYKTPFVSIFYDIDHDTVLEERGVHTRIYVLPRWQTVSGSQYAYSPATVAALPDARLIQAMTGTLLEAGEKMTNPPMVAVQEAIRSDISIYAGGITWVDADYDERLGEVLRPLTQDKSGMPLGLEMQNASKMMIAEAFYLNKFSMPQRAAEMTAYEVGQRVQEYIRNALPIFEPMEADYNGGLCDMTFDTMWGAGAFGSPNDMPRALRGADIQFQFVSPLHDAIESEKSTKFMEAKALLANAIELDPAASRRINITVALREALLGAGVPSSWQRSDDEMAALDQQEAQAAQTAQMLGAMQQGADVAKTLGEANQAFAAAA